MFRWCVLVCLLAVAGLTTVGCGGSDAPELVPVSGKVLLDGQPAGGALVRFVPETGPSSGGQTDENGQFTLLGPGNRPGAIATSHTVTVGCPYNPGAGSSPDGSTQAPAASSACNVPVMYSDVLTSNVTVVVSEDGKDDVVIELNSTFGATNEGLGEVLDVTAGGVTTP